MLATRLPRLLTLLLILATAAPSLRSAPLGVSRVEASARLVAEPIVLDPERPARRRFGALTFLEGWSLTSADPRMGGISALALDGGGLLALSDAGTVMRIGFSAGRPATLRLHGLPDGPGDATRKADRDTEALATDPRTGRHWVSFEQHHEVWRYDPGFRRAEAHAKLPGATAWDDNLGAEALARLPDGRMLAISENLSGPDRTADLLLFAGDVAVAGTPVRRLRYRPPPGGYRVTDAVVLDATRLLVLHRRVSLLGGIGASLGVVDVAALAGDAPIRPRIVAEFGSRLAIDNMEALTVAREGGRTVIWMASDDNFTPIQRTLLLKFALAGG